MKSPSAPASHRISSPPPPELFHRVMIVYHTFNLERQKQPVPIDFLTFWYGEERMEHSPPSLLAAGSGLEEILMGFALLRDKAVEESINGTLSTGATIHIIESIKRQCLFPESTEFWSDSLHHFQMDQRRVIPLLEIADIVIFFLSSQRLESGIILSERELHEEISFSTSETTTASSTSLVLPIENKRRKQTVVVNEVRATRRWCAQCADVPHCLAQ